MRPILYTLFLLTLLFHLRCKKDEAPTLFNLDYVLNFELPAALNTVQTHFVDFHKVPTRIEALLAEHGLTEDKIGHIEPHSGLLEVVLVPENLSFFREIFVEFITDNSKLECFYTPNVPFNAGNQIIMVGTIADFKSLLTNSAMDLRIGMRLREPSPTALSYSLRLTFKAKA